MGYITEFQLTVSSTNTDSFSHNKIYSDIYEVSSYPFDYQGCTEGKWYRHNEDMLTVSEMHTTLLFMLKGKGEGKEDMWVKYYKNGKVQECKAKIVYDDYDEHKLE